MKNITIKNMMCVGLILIFCNACGSSNTTDTENSDKIKKTGQTKSYNEDGVEILDDSLHDDGYYQKGITPQYVRDDEKEIITDTLTGLEWQDTIGVTVMRSWLRPEIRSQCTDDMFYGPKCPDEGCEICHDTSGDTAKSYCQELELDGRGWRLPTLEELIYIVDKGKIAPSIDSLFQYTQKSRYFSSTGISGNNFLPITVDFNEGYTLDYDPKHYNFSSYVRCVRGDQNSSLLGDLARDSQGIVTSGLTKLQWQDNYETSEQNASQLNWEDAISYCETLELNGSDWRLPNINELVTITNNEGKLDSAFVQGEHRQYWSSTSYLGNLGGFFPSGREENNVLAWVLHILPYQYLTGGEDKTKLNSVRCVRTQQE